MKRVRRVLSLLLCTVMLAAALVMPAAAAPLYFTSLNDSLEQLTAETMPVWFGGALYVPLSLFSPTTNTTRVDLGLNVSYSASSNKATLFNLRKMLVFDLNEGTCYSDLTGEEFAAQAISRGGRVYVPVAVVCEFFGFSWSYNVLPTVDQGYLVRVKNEDVALDDARFIDAATELIGRRLRDYNQRMNPKPTTPVTPDPEPVQPDDSPEEKPAAAVYLGFRCVSGEELTAVLDLMDRAGKLGVFFLTPEQIREWDDQVRRMAGTGHVVALAASGEDAAATARLLEEGQRELERAACQRTAVVLAPKDQRERLEQGGWICWQDTLRAGPAQGQGGTAFSRGVIRSLGSRGRSAYLTLEGDQISQVLPSLLRQLEDGSFTVTVPLETRL